MVEYHKAECSAHPTSNTHSGLPITSKTAVARYADDTAILASPSSLVSAS